MQFHPHSRYRLELHIKEWFTLILLIEYILNNTPYVNNSFISPETIINPRSVVQNYVLPSGTNCHNHEKMGIIANIMQDIHISQLVELDKLQVDVQNFQ